MRFEALVPPSRKSSFPVPRAANAAKTPFEPSSIDRSRKSVTSRMGLLPGEREEGAGGAGGGRGARVEVDGEDGGRSEEGEPQQAEGSPSEAKADGRR